MILSASTMEKVTCLRRYWYYKIAKRRSSTLRPGPVAGSAVHSAFAAWNRGEDADAQEAALRAVCEARPLVGDDYRTTLYLLDAWAHLRATLTPLFAGWRRLEVEKRTTVRISDSVEWELVRDVVLQAPDGAIWICDLKTSSRDEAADTAARRNSGQFKAYAWTWNAEHPETPARGVQAIRLIMRKPSKTGVAFDAPNDPPVRFDPAQLDEWYRGVLRRAADIAARDPANLDDWPMADSPAGNCRNQWGCCEYLPVCELPPGDRALKLATDAFEPADAGKPHN